jgi:hypothetical protein
MTLIKSINDLKELVAAIHDARFKYEDVEFNKRDRLFTLNCCTPAEKAPPRERPWQACKLQFHNVLECDITVREEVQYYELSTIHYSERDGRLQLLTHYAMQIELIVKGLSGWLDVTNEFRDNW